MSDAENLDGILGMDVDDRRIISILYSEPTVSHSFIAKKINKSQPAVGARILKLERKHLMATRYGLRLQAPGLHTAVVVAYAKRARQFLNRISQCPFVLNAFLTSGSTNVMVWLIGTSLPKLEEIVDVHFRSRKDVSYVNMIVNMEPIDDAIFPLNFKMEGHEDIPCEEGCFDFYRDELDLDSDSNSEFDDYVPYPGDSRINRLLDIDDEDKKIIMHLQAEPGITHSEIGRRLGRSQPSIGTRIAKLKKKGLLGVKKGVNFKSVESLHLVMVSISASNVSRVLERLQECEYIIGGFRTTGDHSLIALVAGYSLEEIDDIVDHCIRCDDNVNRVETSIILKTWKDLVLPFNFDGQYRREIGCIGCKHCAEAIGADVLLSCRDIVLSQKH